MAHEGNESHYAVCLIEGGAEGSVCVDVDAFLQFNAWIDERLTELEAQWIVPRFEGSSRHATGSWPAPSSAYGLAKLDGLDDDDAFESDEFEDDQFEDEDEDEENDDFGDEEDDLDDFRSGFDN